MDKRDFLKNLAWSGLTLLPGLEALTRNLDKYSHLPASAVAADEDFWAEVRMGYRLKPDYINLENGYYNFMPQFILEAYMEQVRRINYEGSYYMRTTQFDDKKQVAAELADLLGCSKEELIITRNTTESLDTIISGIDWKAGDEAVMAAQDYGAMLNQFKLMAARHGIVNRVVSIPNHPASDDEIVNLYSNAITSKTRLLMICHMINITGQILPVRKICDMAHAKGVEVLVDGAHAVAHIRFNISELNCDYYGSSLHKWLSVPLGAGILYVKKGKAISKWPVFAPWSAGNDDVYKFNHTGTHPVHTDLTISSAIRYYHIIGPDRKEQRLRYLQRYWTDQVRNIDGIILNTPADADRSCGIANVGIQGISPADLGKKLMDEYKIYTAPIDYAGVHGCRVTPNIYTTLNELDTFVAALKAINEKIH
ncbi:MAG: aminotransferase class V-fold PLP-dependent enzyme [Saprospiraceae bacterium]|nr:aminotransferase class V-fold PLP-dependent enzyme [Saprospiraceae bacterium]